MPERVLEQDANGEGEAVKIGDPLPGQLGEAIDDGGVRPEPERAAGAERIRSSHGIVEIGGPGM